MVDARRAEWRPSPTAFINFLQNHDQIGNRALGDRLESMADPRAIEAALAITLLAPMVPMLFMGEEWGSKAPFPFFCDFQGELADAVRNGRRNEFADAYAKYRNEIPDPLDVSTVQAAMLDWEARDREPGRKRRRWFANCWRSAGTKSSRGLPVQVLAARRPGKMVL